MKENDSGESDKILGFSQDNLNVNLMEDIHPEINHKKKTSFCGNCFYTIFPCFRHVDTTTRRIVYFHDTERNVTSWSNKEENHKYSILFFVPIVLFNQFRQFGNFFYLIMTITQFFDALKVGFLFTYLSPLCMVVGFSMLKELYDDLKRRIQDKETNSKLVTILKLNESGREVVYNNKKSSELEIGDIISLTKNSRVPADIVVLKTFNESKDNQAFIKTDQLDGETDWKLRKAPGATQEKSEKELVDLDGFIQYEPPSKLIYNFEGVIQLKNQKEPLNLENTMWASTVVASERIIGIVIYTGKETRARMNSSTPKLKIGILDDELNTANKYLFVIMFFVSLLLAVLKGLNWNIFLIFFRFIVLFCAIIPIALRVNLDVSKTWFSYVISKDELIPETVARNSTIPEELGRISYIFSDKTGTLTKNEMVFKKISMETEQFGEESFKDLKGILSDECQSINNDAPLLDVFNLQKNSNENILNSNEDINNSLSGDNDMIQDPNSESYQNRSMQIRKISKRIRRARNKIIRDTITAMVLCNNVTPTETGFQASSPDEIALVKFADSLNMRLFHRTDKEIKIRDSADNVEEFEILANFPFSSDTKRMGIILKNKKYGHIIYYLKGAENIMMKFVKKDYIGYIKENAENLAVKGLRTLVLTQKLLSQEEFDKWNLEYSEAITSMDNRKEKIAQAVSKLENNMDFLCVTGVEDLLQNEVATTIDNLRNAGMKVWMLTGDKVETATCISISAGIKSKNQKLFTIRYDDLSDYDDRDNTQKKIQKLKELFEEYNKKIITDPHLFIIDGDSLDLALNHCEEEFFKTSMQALSVVCCRCSPTQKRIIVKTIKKYTTARTAAVGDGGNDVAMIQEADVGIGIVGKEGLQASLAADYSIKEFRTLSGLLLWWGRIAYKNTSMVANFVIHRGLIISFNQFIFSLIFYYNAVALYNGMLSFGYSTIFTCLPSISILLDRDVDRNNVLKFPTLYQVLLKGRELNFKNFLFWLFKSLFQSAVIMFGAVFMFEENIFLNIVTVSFTALIYLEILNVYMEINKFHFFMIFALVGTFIVYTITLFCLPSYLDVYILDFITLLKILLLAFIAWVPFFVYNKIKKIFFPQTIEKLNQAGCPFSVEHSPFHPRRFAAAPRGDTPSVPLEGGRVGQRPPNL